MNSTTIELLQRACQCEGLYSYKIDGLRGPKTDAAMEKLIAAWDTAPVVEAVIHCQASAFAYPADLAAFKACKARGGTDLHCFAFGDNGVGQWGANTAQEDTAMVAVHGDILKAKWGSVDAGAHRKVSLTVNGKTISAVVEDRISEPGRIDLNPACAKQLGLRPPFVVPCSWSWA